MIQTIRNVCANREDSGSDTSSVSNNYEGYTHAPQYRKIREYYPSNIIGSNIVNACDGFVYPDLVGSKGETKYFRVIDATGRVDETGKRLGQNANNPQSNKLFYNNKEEYLRHRNIKVNQVPDLLQ